jgi:hypothetical protein
MNRLQISLTSSQYEFLKSESFVTGQSMAGVLRALLDEVIAARQKALLNDDPIWQAIGVGEDIAGPTDVSGNVDKYLYGERVESTQNMPLQRVAEKSNEYDAD